MKNMNGFLNLILITLSLSGTSLFASSSELIPDEEKNQPLSHPSSPHRSLEVLPHDLETASVDKTDPVVTSVKKELDSKEEAKQKIQKTAEATRTALIALNDAKSVAQSMKDRHEQRLEAAAELSARSSITKVEKEDGKKTRLVSASPQSTKAAVLEEQLLFHLNQMGQAFVENSKSFLPDSILLLQQSSVSIQLNLSQLVAARPNVPSHNLQQFDAGVERLENRCGVMKALQEKIFSLYTVLNPTPESDEPATSCSMIYLDASNVQAEPVRSIIREIFQLSDALEKI